jgi:DNA-binding response OmpR family regulator
MVIIDDEDWLLEMMELAIRSEYKNIDLRTFQDSKKAWEELAQRDPDILITGANMGELSGEEIVRRLIEQKVVYPILVMSGWAPAEKWVKSFANKKSNIRFLQKPFKIERLHAEISNLLGRDDKPTLNQQHLSNECKPLLEAATKDLFRKNAFRITGLSVDATTREVARQADKLKMLAELGQDPHTQSAAFPMKPPPVLDDFHEAFQKLKDPEQRLIDEFFWFWPMEFGNGQSDPAMQALSKGESQAAADIWAAQLDNEISGITAKHNLALAFHVRAIDWENSWIRSDVALEKREQITSCWTGALKLWERLANDDIFWHKVTARICQINEPSLKTSFANRMRATLPDALCKINAELALAFAESGKVEFARVHIQLMRVTNQGMDRFEKIAELVLTPARNRLKEQAQRAQKRGEHDHHDAAAAARELLRDAQNASFLVDLFFGKDSDFRDELFDEVASVCNRLQFVYHSATSDDSACLHILHAVLPFAATIELRQQIEKNIGSLKGFIADKELEPVYTVLRSIQESKKSPSSRLARFKHEAIPSIVEATNAAFAPQCGYPSEVKKKFARLFDDAASVLRGLSLDAWNNHQDRQTAIEANDLAIHHSTSLELKQQLAEDKATLQQAGANIAAIAAAKRKSSQKAGLGVLAVVAGIIVLGIINSDNSTSSPPSNINFTPSAPSAPAYSPPQASDNGNSDGNGDSVPSSAGNPLKQEKEEIESERAALEALDAQVTALGREIENDRLYLNRTDQSAVDDFNAKIERYNTLLQRDKYENAAFNEKVDNYNAKLKQYGN